MRESAKTHPITINLNQFELHIALKNRSELTLYFNSPSRRFYLAVIALVVNEMKRLGKITSIPLEKHHDLLALLNDTVGGSAGSSEEENLLSRVYNKWKYALSNLEEAPLFTVLGKKKGYDEGVGKTYLFTEGEKDNWANLFEYKGSHENVRLKFSIDKIGATLDDIVIIYEDSLNAEAWEKFILSLKDGRKEETQPVKEPAEPTIPEVPVASIPPPPEGRISWVSRYRWAALVAAIVFVLGAITIAIWKTYLKPDRDDVASIKKMAFPLPDEPSIAVLPFVNMSGDPKQEFLCDGMADEIITALSKVPRLFVVARYSTFTYKGKPVKVKQVSEDLGVRYVLEGGFHKSGDRVRITAQLIDALTGNHLWAERYDRDLKDIFALQDEITVKVLTAIRVKLTKGELFSGYGRYSGGKQSLDCYLKIMEGNDLVSRRNIKDNNLARRIAEGVLATCPETPLAYMLMAYVHESDYWLGSTKSPQESIEKSIKLTQKALALDDTFAEAHAILGYLYTHKREYEKGVAEGKRAVALNPGDSIVLLHYGSSLIFAGRSEEAIPLFKKAIRLNPAGSYYNYMAYLHLGHAFVFTGRYEEAVSPYKIAIQGVPNFIWPHIMLTADYSLMGREKEARAEAAEVLRIDPNFSLDFWAKTSLIREQSLKDKIFNALRKAGLK